MSKNRKVLGPASEAHRKFLNCTSNFVIFGGGAGSGKALRHGEKVLTPEGFKNIEDMQIGDAVVTPKNTVEYVTGVYPQGIVNLKRVIFQDGATIDCCNEHLWQYRRYGFPDEALVRNTQYIKDNLNPLEDKGSPIIPLTSPVDLKSRGELQIDPYLLGKTLSRLDLKRVGGYIPEEYKYSSIENRYKIIQGLMDSDGYIIKSGEVVYSTNSEKLATDVEFILRSLGFTVTTGAETPRYTDRSGNKITIGKFYRSHVRGNNLENLFSLTIKKDRVRKSKVGNRIKDIVDIESDYATCISISGEDKLFITTNFIVTHNSFQALLLVLKYHKDPNFKAVFIRQTSTQLSQAGGLFSEAQALWRPYGAIFKTHPQMTATFPMGAQVQFKVCAADRDITNFDGLQASLIVFDEAQWHSEVQIKYLESRIRSKAKGPHQLICTANPSMTCYLYQFVQPYLDMATGVPIPARSGVERYYATHEGITVTADTQGELISLYGPQCQPQSYTYISATVYDNPVLRITNPKYVARLENLKRTERERLLLGSWHAKEESAGYFKRSWVEEIDKPEDNPLMRARGMDLAASLASESYPNPDWTASVMMSKSSSGYYIVEHVERYRKLSNSVLEHIAETDKKDKSLGYRSHVIIPEDLGSAGKMACQYMVKYLTEHEVDVRSEKVVTTTSKLSRMQPFLSLAEAGLVKVVKGDWNEMWYAELENFEDGNRNQKDDMWDATATAAKHLLRNVTIPTFVLPTNVQNSPVPRI